MDNIHKIHFPFEMVVGGGGGAGGGAGTKFVDIIIWKHGKLEKQEGENKKELEEMSCI